MTWPPMPLGVATPARIVARPSQPAAPVAAAPRTGWLDPKGTTVFQFFIIDPETAHNPMDYTVARLPSFSSLAYISYVLLIWPCSTGWPISHSRSSSALILLAGLPLIPVARLPSFSTLASFSLLSYLSYFSFTLLAFPSAPL